MPDTTLASHPVVGKKKSKDRITVLLTCSADGEKMDPWVIGKSRQPRCFQGVVKERNSTKAWMVSSIWRQFLTWFDNQVKKESVLLIDNCPAHDLPEDLILRRTRVFFLPPNTTSILQPCVAGVIKTTKALYRKELVRAQLQSLDEGKGVFQPDVKDGIYMISRAWRSITPEAIRNCWSHTKILPRDTEEVVLPDPLPELKEIAEELKLRVGWTQISSQFLDCEDKAPCFPSAEEYLDEVLAQPWKPQEEEEKEEEEERPREPPATVEEALASGDRILSCLEGIEGEEAKEKLKSLSRILDFLGRVREKAKKQKAVTDFFSVS